MENTQQCDLNGRKCPECEQTNLSLDAFVPIVYCLACNTDFGIMRFGDKLGLIKLLEY